MTYPIRVIAAGRAGSFTRYDTPAETNTYPILTPPAAEGILRNVYWHPGFEYHVRRITVLSEVRLYTRMGNELKDVPGKSGTDILQNHTQRTRQYVHAPAYRIEAEMAPWPGCDGEIPKFNSLLKQRLERGQVFQQPYFGLRELTCSVTFDDGRRAWDADANLGPLPLRIDHVLDPAGPNTVVTHEREDGRWVPRTVTARAVPSFFRGTVRRGVLDVPEYRP